MLKETTACWINTGRVNMGRKPANILVAVDGSEYSLEAVRYVARLFPPGRVWFNLFHVMDRVPEIYWDLQASASPGDERFAGDLWMSEHKKRVEGFMESCLRALQDEGHGNDFVTSVVWERKVGIARDIAKEAQKGYDALVVGRHGQSSLKDLLFGSTANKLVTRVADVPVWVIGEGPLPGKILVALDNSEESHKILHYVETLLGPADVQPEVQFFHVIRGRKGFLPDYDDLNKLHKEESWVKETIREFDRAKNEMSAFLEGTIRQWVDRGFDGDRLKSCVSHGGSRAGSIVDEARRGGFGTIVVGRRGLTKVEEFFMGRVSNKVLQLAEDRAVWVVH